jgi:hypothetical protein
VSCGTYLPISLFGLFKTNSTFLFSFFDDVMHIKYYL